MHPLELSSTYMPICPGQDTDPHSSSFASLSDLAPFQISALADTSPLM